MRTLMTCSGIAFLLTLSVPATAAPIGMVDSWTLTSGVQNLSADVDQVFDRTTLVQTPFIAQQHAQIGSSTADTYLNVVIDDNNLVMVVQPQHSCEKADTVWPACLSTGVVFLTPTVDVQLNVTGSYTYHLGGDPIAFYANVRTSDSTAGGSLFNIDYSIDSFLDPSDGTLQFNELALLTAGHRYRVSYKFESDVAGSLPAIGAVVSGSGGILIEAHPVPEPAALGAMVCAALLLFRRRVSSARS